VRHGQGNDPFPLFYAGHIIYNSLLENRLPKFTHVNDIIVALAPLQFGQYLKENQRPEWAAQYINYEGLKQDIDAAVEEAAAQGNLSQSPRQTSLSVARAAVTRDSAEERFFRHLEADVSRNWGKRGESGCNEGYACHTTRRV
jgi:hypothetical protein